MGDSGEFWQNMIHWSMGWQTTPVFLLYIVTLLINLYAEYIMQNARLDESQARNKIAMRIINNLEMQLVPLYWQKAKRN